MSLSGYIVSEWGWKAPFWIGGLISITGVIFSFFIFEPKEGVARSPVKLKDLTSVMQEPSLLKISLLSILAHSIIFSTMFGFSPAYALQIGFKASNLSLIVFSFMIPHAIATLIMRKVFVPFFGEWKSLKMAFFLTSFFTLVIPFVQTKGLFLVIQGFSGFSLGLIFPLLLGMSIESIAPEKRATAMGAYQALYSLGIFSGPFLAGMLNSLMGLEAGFYFTGLLGLAAIILIVFWNRNEAHSKLLSVHNK